MRIPTANVFVSSTWLDLKPERMAVEKTVQQMRETKYVGMEYFGSRDESTRQASLEEVDRCHVYVGIFGGRYGSSITEAEYRRALEKGLDCLIYVKENEAVPAEWREQDPEASARLAELKEELRKRHTVTSFTTPDDLATRVALGLHEWLFNEYLEPMLEKTLRDELPAQEARQLVEGIRSWKPLEEKFLPRLRAAGLVAGPSDRYQLRAPLDDFVGRAEEIQTLTDTLRERAITCISGLPGIGKTELALVVAHDARTHYPDAQLFVPMLDQEKKPRRPSEVLEDCIRAFVGPQEELPKDLNQLMSKYCSILNGKNALIVLDNAVECEQVLPLQPPPGSDLLVTSCKSMKLPGSLTVLKELRPDEARQMLTRIAGKMDPKDADQICQLCGYIPLAIRAAASQLAVTPGLEPEDYVEQLRNERTRLKWIGKEGVDVSLEAAFNLSYEQLSPEAARVFRLLAVFPSSFDKKAEEYVCDDPGRTHLNNLLQRSLVMYDGATKRYHLLNLVRLFAESHLGPEELMLAARRHATHYEGVLRAANELYLKGKTLNQGLTLFDTERVNIQAGQEWAADHAQEDEEAAKLCSSYSLSGAYVLVMRQHPKERAAWAEAGLASAKRWGWREAECRQLGLLGLSYCKLGDAHYALVRHREQLKIAREIPNRQLEGAALNNLGEASTALGETDRALEYYEQSRAILQEVNDRRGLVTVLNNVGKTRAGRGEFRDAIPIFEEQLKIARALEDQRGEGKALTDLGNAYSSLGEFTRAVEIYEQQLVVTRETGNRFDEFLALHNRSNAYYVLGDARRAVEFYEQALVIAGEISFRYGECFTLNNLGEAYADLGETDRAIALHEKALAGFQDIDGRRGEGNVLNCLGRAYAARGDYARALDLYQQALGIASSVRSRHGEGHIFNDMGDAFTELGEPQRALDYHNQALEILRDISDRLGQCNALNGLGRATYLLGNSDRALEYYKEALAIAQEVGYRRDEGFVLFNLSLAQDSLGDRAAAIASAESALAILDQIAHPRAELARRQLEEWRAQTPAADGTAPHTGAENSV